MILADFQIEELNKMTEMISPFVNKQVSKDANGNKVISYGLSSAGYDIRVADEYKIFMPIPGYGGKAVDPKNFDKRLLVDFKGPHCEIPPHSYVLCRSVETFKVPKDVFVTCLGKSTYARCGIHVNVTPLEPGWSGILTIEVSNSSGSPVILYSNEGIAQLVFNQLKGYSRVSYSDRGGKYNNQEGIVTARMKD